MYWVLCNDSLIHPRQRYCVSAKDTELNTDITLYSHHRPAQAGLSRRYARGIPTGLSHKEYPLVNLLYFGEAALMDMDSKAQAGKLKWDSAMSCRPRTRSIDRIKIDGVGE